MGWERTLTAFVAAAAFIGLAPAAASAADDTYNGSQMWLRYTPVTDASLLAQYRAAATGVVVENADANKVYRQTANLKMETGASEKLVESSLEAARDELVRGLGGLLDQTVPVRTADSVPDGSVIVGTRTSSALVRAALSESDLAGAGPEGYVIRSVGKSTVIAGNSELGALYGTLRVPAPDPDAEADHRPRRHLGAEDQAPPPQLLGHRAPVRGQQRGRHRRAQRRERRGLRFRRHRRERDQEPAGDPQPLRRRGAGAGSLGINGITINNVNANNAYLTTAYIAQEAALADALRPYGVHLALSILYTAPTDARFAPDTLTNAAARSLQRRLPRLVDAQGAAAEGGDPGLRRLHREGQLRGPAGSAGLRLRPR